MVPHILLLILLSLFFSATTAPAQELRASAFDLFPRGQINTSLLGVNAFANDPRFGTARAQFRQVKRGLRLKFVRVLVNWNDQLQPSPQSPINFSFNDSVLKSLPPGMDAILVVNGLPSWMENSANWVDGDPRKTLLKLWFEQVISRYASYGRVRGFQIWNEPNDTGNPENVFLGFSADAAVYRDFLATASSAVRTLAPGKLVISAATTAIAQNYPSTLDYNQKLKDLGVESLVDVFAAHYYGSHYETLLFGGVAGFLSGLKVPVWITEIGEKGINAQLSYMQTTMPLLLDLVPGIQRVYYYQFTEATPPESTYGLRNLSSQPTSDLFRWLRRRPKG